MDGSVAAEAHARCAGMVLLSARHVRLPRFAWILRIGFLAEPIFEIWFLISWTSICQFAALTMRRGTGQNGITEK
ncbi:MAG: hypothetical protein E5W55_16650 [Mesorhizobium sp.]|nr:MAG: hypothetical protein E5W55_16650 [Mesorhizobium sp.]